MVAGGTMGMSHHEPSSDSGNPDLNIDRAILMMAKLLKFDKTATSSKHLGVIPKPHARNIPHALTVTVAASASAAAAAATEEDTTGSQPQPKDQAKPPANQKSRKKALSSAPAEPPPPSPSASPTHTEPPPSDSNEDEESAEEDATGGRKKASITQMLNEHQEEELADWWGEHPGLYDKSNEMYRRNVKKDGRIADKAEEMEVWCFDAKMLAGWMKSMRMIYGKEEKKAKGKSGAAPPVLTSRLRWVIKTFHFL